jgi:hypothetical protein
MPLFLFVLRQSQEVHVVCPHGVKRGRNRANAACYYFSLSAILLMAVESCVYVCVFMNSSYHRHPVSI